MKIKLINQYKLQGLYHRDSWGHRWEPRVKIITGLLLVFGIVSLEHLWLLGLSLGTIFVAALTMKLPVKFLLSRLLIITPFFLFMGIPILLGSGYPPTLERGQFLLRIVCRGYSSLLVMVVIVSTQSPQKFFNGLGNMKLPPKLVTIFFLTYRYVFLFFSDLYNLRRALVSRGYIHEFNGRNAKLFGEMAGGVLIKSLDHSEAVYKAMASRGFEGYIPTSESRKINSTDLLKATIISGFILILMIIEGRFLK